MTRLFFFQMQTTEVSKEKTMINNTLGNEFNNQNAFFNNVMFNPMMNLNSGQIPDFSNFSMMNQQNSGLNRNNNNFSSGYNQTLSRENKDTYNNNGHNY